MSQVLDAIDAEIAERESRITEDTKRVATLGKMRQFYIDQANGAEVELEAPKVRKPHRANGKPRGRGFVPDPRERMERREKILEQLREEDLTTAELARRLDTTTHTVKADCAELLEQGSVAMRGERQRSTIWTIPDRRPSAAEPAPATPTTEDVPPRAQMLPTDVTRVWCANCKESSIDTGRKKCAWCDGPLTAIEEGAE